MCKILRDSDLQYLREKNITELLFGAPCTISVIVSHFSCLHPTKEEVRVFSRVRLSVCLLARLLKNACIDLDEMLRVDRCRDMDELINF